MRRLVGSILVLPLVFLTQVAHAHPHAPDQPACTVGEAADDGHVCFPTPAQCATGNFTGVWSGSTSSPPNGTTVRGAYCVAAGETVLYYSGGYFAGQCGTIVVYGATVEDNAPLPGNPNSCP